MVICIQSDVSRSDYILPFLYDDCDVNFETYDQDIWNHHNHIAADTQAAIWPKPHKLSYDENICCH